MHLPTGDLLEKRRGGIDVLRTLGQEIIREKISAVLHIISDETDDSAFEGAIYFKNGQPHLSIASQLGESFGVDAFELIQIQAEKSNVTIAFHEANVALIYSVQDLYPPSVLLFDLISSEHIGSTDWWKNVRYQTHHMRFDTKDLAHDFASLEFSRKRNEKQNTQLIRGLERGTAYSFPSIGQINIPPILGYLQQTGCHILEISNRPSSSTHFECIHVGQHQQHELQQILSTIEHSMFGVDFGCIFLLDFELFVVVHGELFALELLRSTVDLCRERRFTMFIGFDSDVLDQKTTAKVHQATNQLETTTIQMWAEHPEEMSLDSFHENYTDEEEHWFEAQLELMAQSDASFEPQNTFGLEGGSSKLSDELRAEVADSLKGALDSFSNPSIQNTQSSVDLSGLETWRSMSNHPHVQPGKFVSESKIYEDPNQHQISWKSMRTSSQNDKHKAVKIRKVQKQPQRKPNPVLPETKVQKSAPKEIGFRHTPIDELSLPEIKKPHKLPPNVIQESYERQERLAPPQSSKLPLHMQGIGESLSNSDYASNASFPHTQAPSKLKFEDSPKEAIESHMAEDHSSLIASREKATYAQQKKSLDEISKKWAVDIKKSQSNAQVLYDEQGRKLKFFGGDS